MDKSIIIIDSFIADTPSAQFVPPFSGRGYPRKNWDSRKGEMLMTGGGVHIPSFSTISSVLLATIELLFLGFYDEANINF